MQFSKIIKVMVLIFIPLSFSQVSALNTEEALVQSCSGYIDKDEILEDSICYEYINGFIDGAILTDTAIINNIKKEKKEFSGFFKRAYKTRVSGTRKQVPATYFAKFCLPESESRKNIILNLVHAIKAENINKQSFKATLYQTLQKTYKC